MGATYTRQSNFTDGDVITADLFNNEFDQLLATLASSTGHTHDGTAAEGGPISKLLADTITIGTAAGDISLVFDGGSNDGTLKWMEDEDYFEFSDDVLIATNEKIQFRDTAIFINSSADGQLDIVADTEIQIAATTIDINGAADISGNLAVGGNLTVTGDATVTGTTTFNGGTLTLGDAVTDNVVFGADVNSSIIPNGVNGSFDLGSSSQEWRDLFINGTAHIDTLDVDVDATVAGTLGVTGVLTTTATQVATGGITSGSNIVSDTDSTDDLGADGTRWANLFVDGITATDQITATGFTGTLDGILGSGAAATASVTTLDTSGAVNLNLATDSTSSTSGALIVDGGVGIAKKLFVGTTLGVTGVVTANAGVVVDEMTLDADTLTATDDFILDVAGNIEINADGGTITFKDDGATLGTVTSAGFSGLSATVAVSDSNANTNFPIVFHDESNALLDDTGALRYNPSTGQLLVPNLTVAGTTTTVDTVTMEAANAIIFEGATADAHETTLTIVDPTADRTVNIPNQSGTIPLLAAASNTAVTSTPEELNALDGITAVVGELNALDLGSTAVGTAIASKAVILDSNKDYTGIRNLTITGELDAATLDISGAIDVAGTSNLDVVDIDGAVDMASTLQVDGIATFTAIPVANAGLSVKNGSTTAGFVSFFEDSDNGNNSVKLIGPASTADVTLTLPADTGTDATTGDITALAIALG